MAERRVQGRRRRLGEQHFYYMKGCVGGRCAHSRAYAHTRVYAHFDAVLWRAIVGRTCGRAVSGRHNPNSKPVSAPWVNNNILLHPILFPPRSTQSAPPSIAGAPTRCTSHFHREPAYKLRCQVLGGRWLRYFPEFYDSIPHAECRPKRRKFQLKREVLHKGVNAPR